ncbi:MAG: hypothetical protein A2666_00965 [Parcubacteria group bacterium RIFCSPHIGHO2_01_FULL_47_10b]|nr:MAG: hypothetical protein A2666_00965 [Parcubacteria group bacterium RIFCSPHIGHO2_01_FULL_47_10b]
MNIPKYYEDPSFRWFHTIFYPTHKTESAYRYEEEDGVCSRMLEKRVTLFTPWGPKYSCQEKGVTLLSGSPETKTLLRLREIWDMLTMHMPDRTFSWEFLFADWYGYGINNLPQPSVLEYFRNMEYMLAEYLPDAVFTYWSAMRELAQPFREHAHVHLETMVSSEVVQDAQATAQKLGCAGNPSDYLVERIAEARFIEETLHPVKISCVRSQKNREVDGNIPCLYLLPQRFHAPWLI